MVSSQQNKHFLIAYIVQTGTWGLYVCVWRFNWWSVQHHQPQVVHKKRAFEFTAHTHTLVCSICSHPSLSNLHRTYAFTLHQHLQAIAAPWKAPDWPWIPLFHSLPAPQLPPLLFPPALFCSLTYQTPISNSDLVPSASFLFPQIQQWEQNLERFNLDLFRMRCYLASLQGGELPNPKSLLAIASRPTKTTLGRLGIFSVSSFHALVRNT